MGSERIPVEVQSLQSEAEKTRAQVTVEFDRIERQLEELRNISASESGLRDRLQAMRKTFSNTDSEAETLQRQISSHCGGHYFDNEYEAGQGIKNTFSALRSNATGLRADTDAAVGRARMHLQEQEQLKREIASLEADLYAEYFADAKGQTAGLNAAEFCTSYEINSSYLNELLETINQLKAQVSRGDLSGANKKLQEAKEAWLELKLDLLRQAEAIVETHNNARTFQKVLKELGFEYQAKWGDIPHQTLHIQVRGGEGDITITKDGSGIAVDTPHTGSASLMTDVQNAAQRHGVQVKWGDSQPARLHPQAALRSESLRKKVLGPEHPAITSRRKLNAWISNSRPKVGEAFWISVNIGGDARDVAAASVEFPEAEWGEAKSLDLIVAISCLDCNVKPSWQELQLPKIGDSEKLKFFVISRIAGYCEFTVRVYLAKQMIQLQSLHFNVMVAEAQTQPAEAL